MPELDSYEGDVILGRYDDESDAVMTSHCALNPTVEAVATATATAAPVSQSVRQDAPHGPSHCMECVRLLIRTLQAPPEIGGSHTTSTANTVQSPDKDEFAKLARGSPDLLTLQNAILQLQHALTLAQAEAATALDDAAAATRSAAEWQRDGRLAREQVTALTAEHATLVARNERLYAEKRVLKSAYKELVAHRYTTQTQHVQAYVVHALATHEQQLHKNRSRTTTETTDDASHEQQTPSEGTMPALGTTIHTVAVSPIPPTPAKKEVPRNVGFGTSGALGFGTSGALGFGKTFHFKKLEEKKPLVAPPTVVENSVATRRVETIPYEPVRFELIPPSRSSDDEAASTTSMGLFFQPPEEPKRTLAPLIRLDALLLQDEATSCCSMPHNVSFGPDDSIASGLESPLFPSGEDDLDADSPLNESCDPTVLRSLSIPVIHEELPPVRSFKVMPFRPHKFV